MECIFFRMTKKSYLGSYLFSLYDIRITKIPLCRKRPCKMTSHFLVCWSFQRWLPPWIGGQVQNAPSTPTQRVCHCMGRRTPSWSSTTLLKLTSCAAGPSVRGSEFSGWDSLLLLPPKDFDSVSGIWFKTHLLVRASPELQSVSQEGAELHPYHWLDVVLPGDRFLQEEVGRRPKDGDEGSSQPARLPWELLGAWEQV